MVVSSSLDSDLTAAVLAGGQARRLGGRDKAALLVGGQPIIERQLALLRRVAPNHLIVANAPDRFASTGVRIVSDLLPGMGALGGIYTAIQLAGTPRTLVVACDLPFLNLAFLEHLVAVGRDGDVDVVIPRTLEGYQPLCACYAQRAASALLQRLHRGALKVTDALADLSIHEIGPEEVAAYDPDGVLFLNVNTPDDYDRARVFIEGR